jgi:hypothetical protein
MAVSIAAARNPNLAKASRRPDAAKPGSRNASGRDAAPRVRHQRIGSLFIHVQSPEISKARCRVMG